MVASLKNWRKHTKERTIRVSKSRRLLCVKKNMISFLLWQFLKMATTDSWKIDFNLCSASMFQGSCSFQVKVNLPMMSGGVMLLWLWTFESGGKTTLRIQKHEVWCSPSKSPSVSKGQLCPEEPIALLASFLPAAGLADVSSRAWQHCWRRLGPKNKTTKKQRGWGLKKERR